MQSVLKERLQAYITENNPELLDSLQGELRATEFLEYKVKGVMSYVLDLMSEEKSSHVIVELALEKMTEPLRPSRFNYIKEVLFADFTGDYEKYRKEGLLRLEGMWFVKECDDIFEAFGFNEQNQKDPLLRQAIIAKLLDRIT